MQLGTKRDLCETSENHISPAAIKSHVAATLRSPSNYDCYLKKSNFFFLLPFPDWNILKWRDGSHSFIYNKTLLTYSLEGNNLLLDPGSLIRKQLRFVD